METLVALTPREMDLATAQLTDWFAEKVASQQLLVEELEESIEHAIGAHLAIKPIERQLNIACKRLAYYRNLQAAVSAGYVIVPNFPAKAFAIRVPEGSRPKGYSGTWKKVPSSWWSGPGSWLPVLGMSSGEGVYVDPEPKIAERSRSRQVLKKNAQGNPVKDENGLVVRETEYFEQWRPSEWDEAAFPVSLVRPQILKPTKVAMMKKIFDDVAVVGVTPKSKQRYADPIVVGRIYSPILQYGVPQSHVTFFIAWWLDTETL